jgi:hypothetical protein
VPGLECADPRTLQRVEVSRAGWSHVPRQARGPAWKNTDRATGVTALSTSALRVVAELAGGNRPTHPARARMRPRANPTDPAVVQVKDLDA